MRRIKRKVLVLAQNVRDIASSGNPRIVSFAHNASAVACLFCLARLYNVQRSALCFLRTSLSLHLLNSVSIPCSGSAILSTTSQNLATDKTTLHDHLTMPKVWTSLDAFPLSAPPQSMAAAGQGWTTAVPLVVRDQNLDSFGTARGMPRDDAKHTLKTSSLGASYPPSLKSIYRRTRRATLQQTKRELTAAHLDPSTGAYVCPRLGCDTVLGDVKALERHVRVHVKHSPKYECTKCVKTYETRRELGMHRCGSRGAVSMGGAISGGLALRFPRGSTVRF